jgi:hypothetical protein
MGYGEDALTLWALTSQLAAFLSDLGDRSAPGDADVFFRPSLGRGGSPEFGEFDAIVATSQAVYLVETKRDGSSEFKDGVVTLAPRQHRRHQILRWYLEEWRRWSPGDWSTFVGHSSADMSRSFPEAKTPKVGTILARNLEFLLRSLAPQGTRIEDVLLFVAQKEGLRLARVDPPTFRKVFMRAPTMGASKFLELLAPVSPDGDHVGGRAPDTRGAR